MDKDEIILKAQRYVAAIRGIVDVESAWLFGSRAHGTAYPDSDIDIGIFTEAIHDDYFALLKKLYRTRREIDSLIEPHLFVAGKDTVGFQKEVQATGIKIV
jgi:predicted nucleotidyltransferase